MSESFVFHYPSQRYDQFNDGYWFLSAGCVVKINIWSKTAAMSLYSFPIDYKWRKEATWLAVNEYSLWTPWVCNVKCLIENKTNWTCIWQTTLVHERNWYFQRINSNYCKTRRNMHVRHSFTGRHMTGIYSRTFDRIHKCDVTWCLDGGRTVLQLVVSVRVSDDMSVLVSDGHHQRTLSTDSPSDVNSVRPRIRPRGGRVY